MRFWHFLQMYGKVFAIGYKTLENFMSTLEDYIILVWVNIPGSLTIEDTHGIRSFHSVQFNCSVRLDCLRPHELWKARPPCPSPMPGAYSNSCSMHWWCHSTISSSVVPFFSYLQPFPASGSFPMSQFFKSGGQSIGVSASTSVLPMKIQDWLPLGWTSWISLQSKGLSSLLQQHSSKASVLQHSVCIMVQLSHP